MKTVASLSGGWVIDSDMMVCRGNKLLVYPAISYAAPMEHELPELMTLRDIVEDMNRCTGDIYILPERAST